MTGDRDRPSSPTSFVTTSSSDSLRIQPPDVTEQTIVFVTGRLAEASLREVVAPLAERLRFSFEIVVPGVQVAALLHTDLLKRRLTLSDRIDRVILPGWCRGNIQDLIDHFRVPFERGPKDLYDLPEYFGVGKRRQADLSRWSIEIIAEINHAPHRPIQDVVEEALRLRADGANRIDVGCVPGESFAQIRQLVSALRDEGLAVSIDSFDRKEVEGAVAGGADLILSCNHSNLNWVTDLGVEVVAIPESPQDQESLFALTEQLLAQNVPFRADPILEPVGMGFAASLQRYFDYRQRFPTVPMMMGIGNVTELSEVDSGGVNFLLAAICEELQIHSILTTQVINWCRTAVAEFDASRRLVHYAVTNGVLPKHVNSRLVMLRDARLRHPSADSLEAMAAALTDKGFRIFATEESLHLMNSQGHWQGADPFTVFAEALHTVQPNESAVKHHTEEPITASHAFYLGYELARAELSRLLGKQYVQDAPIAWGIAGEWQASSTADRHNQ
ncbi:MAG: dihydropteroate synthase [Planctomycetaceae bacterium]|nr:dihydropteroate synthase [Planctomycetaceae bacterium]